MKNSEILNVDFNIVNQNLPKNLYALRFKDVDNDKSVDIVINHAGFCPKINSEREQSKFNDYLSNLEYKLVDEFYKLNKMKKPETYYSKIELMTDENGDLYHISKTIA